MEGDTVEPIPDDSVERIRDLVCEASGELRAAPSGPLSQQAAASLAYLRAELLALAAVTDDREAMDAACGCADEIDAALARPARREAA